MRRLGELLIAEAGHPSRLVDAARQELLDLGRQLVGERDLEPVFDLMRDLVRYTPFDELVARRRELG